VANLKAHLGPLELRTPVIAASGTFGFGEEYSDIMELDCLGALVVKGLTLKPRPGNSPPRIVETPAGLLNAIGLENPGLDVFLARELPRLREQGVPVIVNIAGETEDEYVVLAAELCSAGGIIALELNVSCPNVEKGGLLFGTAPYSLQKLVQKVRESCDIPLIVKLSPNVTDIVELAQAAQQGGADILSLINTIRGMVIDVHTMRPVLGNESGGLSGPAMRPVAVRMVCEVFRHVHIPIIGMGGIMQLEDALQFILAGAGAVAVGTGNFVDPLTIPKLVSSLDSYLEEKGYRSLEPLVGAAVV